VDVVQIYFIVELEKTLDVLTQSVLLAEEKILVFLSLALSSDHLPVDHTSFKIEAFEMLWYLCLDRVGHKYKVDWNDSFHPNLKHSVDPCQEGVSLFQVSEVVTQCVEEDIKLRLEHCLDDEAAVLAEEEKAATFASRLSCLSRVVEVLARVER